MQTVIQILGIIGGVFAVVYVASVGYCVLTEDSVVAKARAEAEKRR